MVILLFILLSFSYEEALQIDPENPDLLDLLDQKINLLKELGRLEEVVEW